MSNTIRIHRMMINHRLNGLSIKNWANNIAIYHSCGHGSHGKIEPTMAIIHKIIHIIHKIMSIYYNIDIKLYRFCVVKYS